MRYEGHEIGDRVILDGWTKYDERHHPEDVKGHIIKTLPTSYSDKKVFRTNYFTRIEWDNGYENTFYRPYKYIKIIRKKFHIGPIDDNLFEI